MAAQKGGSITISTNIYGYIRVSTKEQNEDRQLIALREMAVPEANLYVDKQSGKDAATQFGKIGEETVLKGAGKAAQGTVFGVQFDNLAIDAKKGDTLDVEIGSTKVTLTLDEKKYTASDLADAINMEFAKTANGKIGGQAFTAKVGDDGTSVIFTQTAAPTGTADTVEASMDVKMTYTPTGGTPAVLNDGIQTFEGEEDDGASEGTAESLSAGVTFTGDPTWTDDDTVRLPAMAALR